jgi:methionyl aminopeptidase
MAHQHHFSVIENLTGHGVGTKVHEDPSVYNYPHKDSHRFRFKKNMTLAIEPILAFRSKKYIEHKGNKFNLYTEFGDQ